MYSRCHFFTGLFVIYAFISTKLQNLNDNTFNAIGCSGRSGVEHIMTRLRNWMLVQLNEWQTDQSNSAIVWVQSQTPAQHLQESAGCRRSLKCVPIIYVRTWSACPYYDRTKSAAMTTLHLTPFTIGGTTYTTAKVIVVSPHRSVQTILPKAEPSVGPALTQCADERREPAKIIEHAKRRIHFSKKAQSHPRPQAVTKRNTRERNRISAVNQGKIPYFFLWRHRIFSPSELEYDFLPTFMFVHSCTSITTHPLHLHCIYIATTLHRCYFSLMQRNRSLNEKWWLFANYVGQGHLHRIHNFSLSVLASYSLSPYTLAKDLFHNCRWYSLSDSYLRKFPQICCHLDIVVAWYPTDSQITIYKITKNSGLVNLPNI